MFQKTIAATPGMLQASWRNVFSFPFIFSLISFCVFLQSAIAQAPLVSLQNGQLVYNKYANARQTNVVNQIPDFSNSGYRGGGVRIPDVAVVKTIQPIPGNCRALIQSAIDSVAALPADANGHRGAILLKAGVYPVDSSLSIRTGGIVLRGEGNGLTGTVLIATRQVQHNFIILQGAGSGYGEVSGSRVHIADAYVPTGTKTITVPAGHSFAVGNNIVIQKTPNEAWIDTLNMRQYGWTTSQYRITFERQVVAVQGNTLTLNIPIVDPIEETYGGGDVYRSNVTGRIREIGIENMRIESDFISDTSENHGWVAVYMARVENSWVRNVVVKYFGNTAVSMLGNSRFNTVEDCAMIDPKSITTGGRKYSFNLDGYATSNLFQRCMTWGGRHDYVSGARVTGPNVFLDCISENTFDDIGPHHRYSTGLLFDNIYGGRMRVQDRGASGTGHGWAGAQTLFWNCRSVRSDFEVQSPPTARNWGIGCIGLVQVNTGYWESWGTHVLPRSLYLQQLQERMGMQAVNDIATPQQMQGTLRDSLRTRAIRIAGEPRVSPGTVPGSSFDLTDNGRIISAQYPNTNANEDYPRLIDNSSQTKYYRSGRTNLWVQYQSTVAAIVTYYTITSANDVPTRDPSNWTLAGSNDGVNWTTIDTRAGETFATRFLKKTYLINNNMTAYSYYRLTITGNNGHTGTQFAEWELFERRQQTITLSEIQDKTYGDEPFELVASASSGLPVTTELIAGPGILTDSFVTITGAGAITLRFSQAGNDNYFPVVVEKTVTVNKANQSISFSAISPKLKYEQVPLSSTSSSGLPVGFTVVAGSGQLTGNTLKLTGEGLVTIQAGQPGNENYEAGSPVQQTILVLGLGSVTDEFNLRIFPNPTRGAFTVRFIPVKGRNLSFTVFNSNGSIAGAATVLAESSTREVQFDIGAKPNGFYFLHVTDGLRRVVRMVIKY
ncbi:T9SS type A sorting domain-containing protein [Niastella caeni]|uniref:T9SS type A sorting domain-containing protein n=1 Tax=Niastella caeni TaxID=2569763 RepID=A0A4S8HFZ0_9BACT|nr:T9SS type A sorting domain-containing protein [Niastella caeni]THU34070.1 T9SS type A sorting domain-containing protein [Niastella caeni]